MVIHSLFPLPVGIFKLERDFTKEEITFIKNQEKRFNDGNMASVDVNLLCHDELKNLSDYIQASLDEYLSSVYSPKNNIKAYITQSWANYTDPGGYHHKHAHPNSFVSGVIYIEADPEKDKIMFLKDSYQQIKITPKDYNIYNSRSWWFEAGARQMYLFPSNTLHMVPPTESSQTRISIAFNTFLKGDLGNSSDLDGLCL